MHTGDFPSGKMGSFSRDRLPEPMLRIMWNATLAEVRAREKAKADLAGTYSEANNATVLHMKLAAPNMEVQELEAMLPALDIVLPQGSSLQGGTASANVRYTSTAT